MRGFVVQSIKNVIGGHYSPMSRISAPKYIAPAAAAAGAEMPELEVGRRYSVSKRGGLYVGARGGNGAVGHDKFYRDGRVLVFEGVQGGAADKWIFRNASAGYVESFTILQLRDHVFKPVRKR